MTKSIITIAAGVMLAIFAGGMAVAPTTQAGYAQDASDLGSADFAVRRAATQRLWQAGMVAEPYLKAAAKSDNPETVERAAALLQYIDQGIVPSTPPAVIHLLEAYRQTSDAAVQGALIGQLCQAGTDGVRILLRLRDRSSDVDRMRIDAILAQSPRVAVALLLREQNRPAAEELLGRDVSEDDSVAYWLVRGKLHDRIEMYRRQGDTRMLSHVEWADGDGTAALRDARAGENTDLIQRILIGRGDWAALAKEMQAGPPQPTVLFEGERAMVDRFAGDTAEAARILEPISESVGANHNPNPNAAGPAPPVDRGAAVALCINDRPGEAIPALLDQDMREAAADLMQSQLHYKQMLALLDHVDPTDPQTISMQAEFAGVIDFLGDHRGAEKTLAAAAAANAQAGDISIYESLCQSAAQMHRPDLVDAYLLDALTHHDDVDSSAFYNADIPDPDDAYWWWRALHDREEPYQALQAVEAVANQRASASDSAKLAKAVEAWSLTQSADVQPAIVKAVVASMKIAGAPADQIIALIRHHAEAAPSPQLFLQLGDALADQHDWPAAAAAFGQAADLDPAQPVAVFLHGWALMQSGDTPAGQADVDLAHLLPLGDMQLRLDLFNAARARGLAADADREQKLMLALGDPETGPMIELYRTCAGDAEKRQDFAAAVRYSEQELVGLLATNGFDADQTAYTDLPGQIHRLAAMADFAAGKPAAAMAQAKVYYKDLPDDPDGLIALVRCADAAGAATQADAIYKWAHDTYAQLCRDYPESGPLHNQLAWTECRCRRDLDNALAHAKKAVALVPDDTASIDTLAETYYQRHEFQKAIDTIQKCIKLTPRRAPHARKQLARFQLALKTGVADNE